MKKRSFYVILNPRNCEQEGKTGMTIEERYTKAKRALFEKAYEDLNDRQREAVFSVNGPLLVLAGAGSGKTTVLVRRIAFIIRYGNAYMSDYVPYGITEETVTELEAATAFPRERILPLLDGFTANACPPWRMLAITFTNKAANEIKARLATVLSDMPDVGEIWAGTFHSVCMRILRQYGERLGYQKGFSIYDTDDTKKTVSASMKDAKIDEKAFPVKSVMSAISRAKDRLMPPDDYEREIANDYRSQQIARIYRIYQNKLKTSNAMDFDDIIMQTVFLLRDHEDIRTQYQNRFRYVSVDEYQDTNEAQFHLTRLLAGGSNNLMVVGDDDQSIYRFRGATIENILGFDRNYECAKVIKLEQNYRSTGMILRAANAVISNNRGRRGKELWTDQGEGSKITVRELPDHNMEARFVADTVQTAVAKKQHIYKDFAVLYRTNAQSNSIERAFTKSGVPYRVLGGTRFTDRKEIRDIVAYLQLINNHGDRERLLRIINEPKRKIGDRTLEAVGQIAAEQNCSLFHVLETADTYVALSRTAPTLMDFAQLIHELTDLASEVSLDVLFDEVLERSGYRKMLEDAGEEERERLDNLAEFKSNIVEYCRANEQPTLTGFLEETALIADVDRYDETADAVVMMTVHSAKGLEFPVVFLPGMEDGIFPGMQTVMAGSDEMEEERRLAYVAITRAKEALYILHAKNRLMYARTVCNPVSRFVGEIPEELKDSEEMREDPDYYGGGMYGSRFGQKSYHFGDTASDAPQRQNLSPDARRKPRTFSETEHATVNRPLMEGGVRMGGKPVFKEGDRVRHMTFGDGEVLSVKSMGADVLYEIMFDTAGIKKLMATYAKLKKIE